MEPRQTSLEEKLVGPPGLEPGTNGFTLSRFFNRVRTISSPSPANCAALGSGTLMPVIKSTRCFITEATRSQVVSAPSDSVLPAWLRIAGRVKRDYGFPEFIPFILTFSVSGAPF